MYRSKILDRTTKSSIRTESCADNSERVAAETPARVSGRAVQWTVIDLDDLRICREFVSVLR